MVECLCVLVKQILLINLLSKLYFDDISVTLMELSFFNLKTSGSNVTELLLKMLLFLSMYSEPQLTMI